MQKITILLVLICLILAGCGGEKAALEVQGGTILIQETFDSISTASWESYSLGSLTFGVVEAKYAAITTESVYVWSLNQTPHTNVIIEVTAQQLSAVSANKFGVMCRADGANTGAGYYFLIDGSGQFSIRRGDGERHLALVDWAQHEAIQSGHANILRAICVDDYLAFYANDTFLAEIRDSTLTEGYAGFAVNAGENAQLAVTFDDLTIREAHIAD